jgi:hypothetical protein
MTTHKSPTNDLDPVSDPFGERSQGRFRKCFRVLGANITFDSNSPELLALLDIAYRDLPRHRLHAKLPELHITLQLAPAARRRFDATEPDALALTHGAGMLAGSIGPGNYVIVAPAQHSALVVVAADMLRFPYHVRYELLEFAVYTLAARAQQFVPLHAACVGIAGRGVILMGPSGAGKSTVALHCALDGFEFLAEDSVFVDADGMRATGVANFLHIRTDSLHWLVRSDRSNGIRRSPLITRRSGAKKREIDLRRHAFRLAPHALQIVAIVFLTEETADRHALLRPLRKREARHKLVAMQAYGCSRPEWKNFNKGVGHIETYELRRGRHPNEATAALRELLQVTHQSIHRPSPTRQS